MQDKVKGPAIALVVIGVLSVLLMVVGLFAQTALLGLYKSIGMPEDQLEQVRAMQGANFVMMLVMSLFGIAGAGFIAWSGLQMMKLRAWTPAVIASFLVMIPCFSSVCCLIGLPIGIWSLVVLFNADVKRAFEGQAAV